MFVVLLILLVIDALLLATAVLLQAGQGGGLASMGGGASTESFVGGRQAVTILTKMSWWCGGIFLGLCLMLAGLSARGTRPRSVLEGMETTAPTPVTPLPLDTGASAPVQPQPQNPGR